jgi:hypothetical protein
VALAETIVNAIVLAMDYPPSYPHANDARQVQSRPESAFSFSRQPIQVMKINIFLSHPKPINQAQKQFIDDLSAVLADPYQLACNTLGKDSYSMEAPLTAIRQLMMECNGVLVVAFRRYWVEKGNEAHQCDLEGVKCKELSETWMTSPWCHIEAAMGFQLGMPIMVLRESGVLADGLLDRGVRGAFYPEFDLSIGAATFLQSDLVKSLLPQWSSKVQNFRVSRGQPGPFAG